MAGRNKQDRTPRSKQGGGDQHSIVLSVLQFCLRQDGKVEFIDSIGLSLTCDHQVIDGAPGARFLKVVKEKIEKVESLCTI